MNLNRKIRVRYASVCTLSSLILLITAQGSPWLHQLEAPLFRACETLASAPCLRLDTSYQVLVDTVSFELEISIWNTDCRIHFLYRRTIAERVLSAAASTYNCVDTWMSCILASKASMTHSLLGNSKTSEAFRYSSALMSEIGLMACSPWPQVRQPDQNGVGQ